MNEPGLSDHQILMELREDVKLILARIPTYVTWGRLGAALGVVGGLVVGAIKLF